MADKKADEEELLKKYNVEQRRALNNAYAALVADQNIQTFHAFTFEEAVAGFVESTEGEGTELRPSKMDRVDRIANEIESAIVQLKLLPPEQFLEKDEEDDVNTPPENTA